MRRGQYIKRAAQQPFRTTCLDCAWKHLSQAFVNLREAKQGYPQFKSLVVGHLAEASDELLDKYPKFANEIRQHRLQFMENHNYLIPFKELLEKVCAMREGGGCACNLASKKCK